MPQQIYSQSKKRSEQKPFSVLGNIYLYQIRKISEWPNPLFKAVSAQTNYFI